MNRQELIKTLEELKEHAKHLIELNKYESYWQGKTEAYVNAIALAKQLDEPKKPVIPQLVAGWLEKSTDPFTKAEKIAYLIKSKDGDSYYFCDWFVRDGIVMQEQGDELYNWSVKQSYEMLLSLYNGYEVEKEQFYEVVFREDESDRYLLMKLGEKCYEIAPESENDGYRTQYFTESEIKAIDERYWSFAVPVEEVTNAVLSAFAKRRLEQEEDAE